MVEDFLLRIIFDALDPLKVETLFTFETSEMQGGARNVVPFYHPIKTVTSQYL